MKSPASAPLPPIFSAKMRCVKPNSGPAAPLRAEPYQTAGWKGEVSSVGGRLT
jgi:hypothetical protein